MGTRFQGATTAISIVSALFATAALLVGEVRERGRSSSEEFKTQLPPEHRNAALQIRTYLLHGNPNQLGDEQGFVQFPRLLFEAVSKDPLHKADCPADLWHPLNHDVDPRDLDQPLYRRYGSDYTGKGPYMVSRGRGRYETNKEDDFINALEANWPVSNGVPIYYKLGDESEFLIGPLRGRKNTFSLVRLRIDILKPLEFAGHLEKLRTMKLNSPEKIEEFRSICERSGVIVYPFKWKWEHNSAGWKPDLGVEAKNLPPRCFKIRDAINGFIYNDQPNAFWPGPAALEGN